MWAQCERMEYDVFVESGYIEPHPQRRVLAFDQYASVEFMAALGHANTEQGGSDGGPTQRLLKE